MAASPPDPAALPPPPPVATDGGSGRTPAGTAAPAGRSAPPASPRPGPGRPIPARPALRHRLEYAAIRGVAALGRLLGEGGSDRLGAGLGRLAYRPFGIRRRVVESQLAAAFPERDAAWVRATAAGAYAHLGREALALLRLIELDAAGVRERTVVEGLDACQAAIGRGRGVVLVTGHLGNWEVGGAALAARGVPLDVVTQRQSNPRFDRALNQARERLGMRVIDRRSATSRVPRALRAGRVVAFVADQDARAAGIFVPFLGRPASTHRGPAVLAARAGAPLFLGTALREPAGRYRIALAEVGRPECEDFDEATRRWTAAFTARLDAAVRRAPEQYFWHHRRWKTGPPEEPVPEAAV